MEPPITPTQNRYLIPLLIGCLIISIGSFIAGTWYHTATTNIPKKTSLSATSEDTPSTNTTWKKPESNQKGFPIFTTNIPENSRTLQLYSFTTKQVTPLPKKSIGMSGASGIGSSDPLVSPNFLYTAFIDNDTHNLWLVSNETKKSVSITSYGGVAYITAWSPDSSKIIYVIQSENSGQEGPGDGILSNAPNTFDPHLDPGFFLFDTNTGKTQKLYPLSTIEGFIDDDRVFTFVSTDGTNNNDRLVVFNTKTFTMDTQVSQEKFGFGALQYTFTQDGKYWTYMLSRNPTTDANIIYAPFPQKEGVQIDSGAWAQVQNSHINPQGTYVAYSHQDTYTDGRPNYMTFIYNTKTKEKFQAVPGMPMKWFDENQIIIATYPSDTITKYTLYNVQTKTAEKMN